MMKTLRVMTYVIVVMVATCLVAARSARAEMGRSSMSLGRHLAPIADLVRDGHVIRLNGQRVLVSVDATKESVDEVLDRVEKGCRESGAVLPTIARAGDEREGTVACLVAERAADWTKFRATHDLGAIGRMQYVYARAIPAGGTQVIVTATDEHFVFDGWMPAKESQAKRTPDGLVTLMDAEIESTPYAVRVYRATAEAEGRFRKSLSDTGWRATAPDTYVRDGRQLLLTSSGGTLTVSSM